MVPAKRGEAARTRRAGRGTISAAAVAVSLSLVSAVRDAVLIKCLRSDVRTADVVLRELARRANIEECSG